MGEKHVHPPTFFGFCPLLFFLPVFPSLSISTTIRNSQPSLLNYSCSHVLPTIRHVRKEGRLAGRNWSEGFSIFLAIGSSQVFNFVQHFDFYWLLYGRAYQLGAKIETTTSYLGCRSAHDQGLFRAQGLSEEFKKQLSKRLNAKLESVELRYLRGELR